MLPAGCVSNSALFKMYHIPLEHSDPKYAKGVRGAVGRGADGCTGGGPTCAFAPCNGAPGWEEAAAGGVPVPVGGGQPMANRFHRPFGRPGGARVGITLKADRKKRGLSSVPVNGTADKPLKSRRREVVASRHGLQVARR